MAGHSLTTSAIRATLAGTALICLATSANADPVYHLTVCGGGAPGAGSPCFVQQQGGPAPAGALDGLNEAAFETFFNAQGFAGNEPYGWTVTSGNTAGLIFGHVLGSGSFLDTQFVFQAGQVLCCTADFPYRLIALNDHGLFIGTDGEFPFASSAIGAFNVSPMLPTLDDASQQFIADPDLMLDGSDFLALDNAGRISGFNPIFGGFILAPADPATAELPEPSTWLLLVSWVAFFCWYGSSAKGARDRAGKLAPQ